MISKHTKYFLDFDESLKVIDIEFQTQTDRILRGKVTWYKKLFEKSVSHSPVKYFECYSVKKEPE